MKAQLVKWIAKAAAWLGQRIIEEAAAELARKAAQQQTPPTPAGEPWDRA